MARKSVTAKKSSTAEKMKRKVYEKELHKLQVELCRLQDWVKAEGARAIIVFEGRDAAGKGGTIKAITERVSPRVFPAMLSRCRRRATCEKELKMYMQRYMAPFSGGRRSRDLRSQLVQPRRRRIRHGVLRPKRSTSASWSFVRSSKRYVIEAGIILIKIWLEVGKQEQERRFLARVDDPLRQWKLSPMDLESYKHWYDYSKARTISCSRRPTASARALVHRAYRTRTSVAAG